MADLEKHPLLPATEKEAALRRIGYYRHAGRSEQAAVNPAGIVEWFIRLASTDVETLAPSELGLLKIEYRALQEIELHATQSIVTAEDFTAFCAAVRRHVEELADIGKTTFGPFTMTRAFMSIPGEPHSGISVGESLEVWKGVGLLYILSLALERVRPLAVKRCPYCQTLFLQPRIDAGYCSRSCQASAYAKRQRDNAKTAKRKRLRKST